MLKFLFPTWLLITFLNPRLALSSALEYPAESLVRLRSLRQDDIIRPTDMYCTATILNPAYLLTHTRCLETYSGSTIKISISFINTLIGDEAKGLTARNITWYRRGVKDNSTFPDDIALVELTDSHVQFSNYVHPAVLYFGDFAVAKEILGVAECVVMGWTGIGFQVYISYFVHTLTIGNVTLVGDDVCRKAFPGLTEAVCIRSKEDLCDLEIGSPLACGTEGRWLFLGYYTGINSCDTNSKTYVFRKLSYAWDWLNVTSKGIYYLTSENLLGPGSLRSNSSRIITVKLFQLLICLLLVKKLK